MLSLKAKDNKIKFLFMERKGGLEFLARQKQPIILSVYRQGRLLLQSTEPSLDVTMDCLNAESRGHLKGLSTSQHPALGCAIRQPLATRGKSATQVWLVQTEKCCTNVNTHCGKVCKGLPLYPDLRGNTLACVLKDYRFFPGDSGAGRSHCSYYR